MSDYDNNLRGALFRNQKKSEPDGNPKWPDYKGQCEIGGVEYWISAWLKEAKSGIKFMSLQFEEKDAEKAGKVLQPKAGELGEDDIPF